MNYANVLSTVSAALGAAMRAVFSSVYPFVRIEAGDFVEVRKMVVIR